MIGLLAQRPPSAKTCRGPPEVSGSSISRKRAIDRCRAAGHADIDQRIVVVAHAAARRLLEYPGAMPAHQDGGDGQRDSAPAVDIEHGRVAQHRFKCPAERLVAGPHVPAALRGPVDGTALSGDAMREYLRPMHAVQVDDLLHRPADGEGAANDCARAGSGDEVEARARDREPVRHESGRTDRSVWPEMRRCRCRACRRHRGSAHGKALQPVDLLDVFPIRTTSPQPSWGCLGPCIRP